MYVCMYRGVDGRTGAEQRRSQARQAQVGGAVQRLPGQGANVGRVGARRVAAWGGACWGKGHTWGEWGWFAAWGLRRLAAWVCVGLHSGGVVLQPQLQRVAASVAAGGSLDRVGLQPE